MIAVAIVLSYGRAELGELLTQWIKQSRPTPLLVWLDGYAGAVNVPALGNVCTGSTWAPRVIGPAFHVHHAQRTGPNSSIGVVRAAAVELARELYSLGPLDSFLVLDDDDYYSPSHAARTIAALERAPHGWTGAQRVAYQWHKDQMPPELVRSEGGPGQHAAWGVRLDLYDRAGGYLDDAREDTSLGARMGWLHCTTHAALTHVRRQYGSTLSSVMKGGHPGTQYDRDQLRRDNIVPSRIEPTWRPELAELECWTLEREALHGR